VHNEVESHLTELTFAAWSIDSVYSLQRLSRGKGLKTLETPAEGKRRIRQMKGLS